MFRLKKLVTCADTERTCVNNQRSINFTRLNVTVTLSDSSWDASLPV